MRAILHKILIIATKTQHYLPELVYLHGMTTSPENRPPKRRKTKGKRSPSPQKVAIRPNAPIVPPPDAPDVARLYTPTTGKLRRRVPRGTGWPEHVARRRVPPFDSRESMRLYLRALGITNKELAEFMGKTVRAVENMTAPRPACANRPVKSGTLVKYHEAVIKILINRYNKKHEPKA